MKHCCCYTVIRDNDEVRQLTSKKRLEAIFYGMLFAILMVAVPYLLYEFIKKLWSLFTPGRQEIGTIIVTILIGIGVLITVKFCDEHLEQENEAEKKLRVELEVMNDYFKKKIAENNSFIYALKEATELKK